ncbi:long-chain fatty acid--CoA ligase [Mesorhizobium sp. M3A.F.Ca.ET.080.04.2.1]|uniref:class I adenylate-forming enzyme family protein n=1 Tax=Mesorhizobium sp. M3A.F.Ca.ET.080.04.2.1 TaxID=2493676 RepID=UPI000F75A186|nr:AMP-binding protein [Mesorhizobium sp. M3A.F.Ca.ET.080.04.2.1]AZO07906.1 long-chain fatty acid--CoA ligase [Mesorhizobium sp. M3A.F.Ca.ET.080.04.2.1]RWF18302.1 MAG: long-chain fatty acid--CoA ligase [Mesorhizobium sp.]
MVISSMSALGCVSSILGDYGPQALQRPDKLALLWEHGSRTYAQLRQRALRLASALREMGLETGDRVASLLFNRGETFELYFACAYAGLTFVPVSFRLTSPEIASILNDCQARIVFTEPELMSLLDGALPSLGRQPHIVEMKADAGGAVFEQFATTTSPIARPIATDVQMILYTSGTTGRPKGVAMRSQAIVWCAMQQVTQFRHLDHNAVMLLNAPMFNTAAMNESSIPTFFVGGTVAIMPSRGWSARRLTDLIERWRVTHVLMFPSMFRELIAADNEERIPLSTMSWWYTGGENCPPALMAEVRRRWQHVSLTISYGSTESGMATLIEGDDIEKHPGSVGRVAPGQSIRLLDANGVDVPIGEVGEVWTAGPSVMANYWESPQLDAETVRDGWLKIGDLARMDDEGWIYIVGRTKDLIISKGQNIYPAEIENAVRQHPAVLDVAVVGVPDAEFGEAVCACVMLRKGASAGKDEILAFALQRLASYKKPRHLLFLDAFPVRNTTKVDKVELARICAAMLADNKVGI